MRWRLLRDLPDDKVRWVLASAHRRRFAKGMALVYEGDAGAGLHLIAKGRVAVRVTSPLGDVLTLELLGSGDIVGELALVDPDPGRAATVVALEPTETLVLDRDTFAELSRQDPSVRDILLVLMAERVRRLDARLLEAVFVPADIRILRRLLELSDTYGGVVPLTQDDLAGLSGANRSTVNRVLRRELERGTVTLARGRMTVCDREALARRAL